MDNQLDIIQTSGDGDKLCVDGHVYNRKLIDFDKSIIEARLPGI